MKKLLVTIAALTALALTATVAQARVGWTLEECAAQYGAPIFDTGTSLVFNPPGFQINVTFFGDRACKVAYTPQTPLSTAQAMKILKKISPTKWVAHGNPLVLDTKTASGHQLEATYAAQDDKVEWMGIIDFTGMAKHVDRVGTVDGQIEGL